MSQRIPDASGRSPPDYPGAAVAVEHGCATLDTALGLAVLEVRRPTVTGGPSGTGSARGRDARRRSGPVAAYEANVRGVHPLSCTFFDDPDRDDRGDVVLFRCPRPGVRRGQMAARFTDTPDFCRSTATGACPRPCRNSRAGARSCALHYKTSRITSAVGDEFTS